MGAQKKHTLPTQLWTEFNPKKGSQALKEFRRAIIAFGDSMVVTVFTFTYPGKNGETLIRTCTVGPPPSEGLQPVFWDRIRLQKPVNWPAGEFHLQEVGGVPLAVVSAPRVDLGETQAEPQPEKDVSPPTPVTKGQARKQVQKGLKDAKKASEASTSLLVHLLQVAGELAGLVFLDRMTIISSAQKKRLAALRRQLS